MDSPYAGGFAMIACALNGRPVSISGSVHAGRRDSIMAFSCFLCIDISPGPDGIKPLFLAISTAKNHSVSTSYKQIKGNVNAWKWKAKENKEKNYNNIVKFIKWDMFRYVKIKPDFKINKSSNKLRFSYEPKTDNKLVVSLNEY